MLLRDADNAKNDLHSQALYKKKRNTLGYDESNYSSRIVCPTFLPNLVILEIALFNPSTPKTTP